MSRDDILEALMDLAHAVGKHPDSMFDGAPLNAAFVKAAEAIRLASPEPTPLTNVIEIPFAAHSQTKEPK